jgi:hypothetical protein
MKMNKFALSLATGLALFAVPAHAALTVNLSLPSGTFDNPNVNCSAGAPCSFMDTATFTTPAPYNLVSASITTIAVGGIGSTSDINFTSVTLNGVALTLTALSGGVFEVGGLANLGFLAPGSHTLVVSGTTFGLPGNDPLTGLPRDGSYSGTLTFATRAAVPEPATWLSMVAGFAALGFAMRTGTAAKRRVNFNFA